MSDLPRKNGWTIAEHVGDATPDPTQRLLNHAVWDHDRAMAVVREFVVEQLGSQPLRVAALDESGQEKQGEKCRDRHYSPYDEHAVMPTGPPCPMQLLVACLDVRHNLCQFARHDPWCGPSCR